MKTLIVPCAGKSTRFQGMKPKWMLTHPNGKLVIEEAILGLPLDMYDRIIITIVKEHSEKYEAKLILEQVFKENKKIEICELDDFTSSQSETVYRTLSDKKVIGEFVVKDSDNQVQIDTLQPADFVVGLDINKFHKEIHRLKSKSFLIVNDQDIVTDIIEKRISSEKICLGVYGFSNPNNFNEAYEYLSQNNTSGEIYLSHIISYLIGTKKSVYTYIESEKFEDWGTLIDWQITQKQHTTYFVDIDGILLHNKGKYGKENWYNFADPIKENLDIMKRLQDEGAQIILTTARGKDDMTLVNKILDEYGIQPHQIVTGCNHSPRVLINDFAPTNPYPSAKAVNVPRNGSLATYIEK